MVKNSSSNRNKRTSWGHRLGESWALRLVLLTAVVVVLTGCLAVVAFRYESYRGLICLATASGVCWFTGVFMVLFGAFSNGENESTGRQALLHVAIGWGFRMGLPLLLCAIVAIQWGQPVARTLARYLLIIYPVVLITETWLTVKQRQHLNSSGLGK